MRRKPHPMLSRADGQSGPHRQQYTQYVHTILRTIVAVQPRLALQRIKACSENTSHKIITMAMMIDGQHYSMYSSSTVLICINIFSVLKVLLIIRA